MNRHYGSSVSTETRRVTLVLKTKIEDILKTGRGGFLAIRDRVHKGLTGRSRQVVAVATLAGVTAIGLAAATLDNTPTETTSSTEAYNERLEALDRANRAVRETVTPEATTPAPEPTPSETTAPEPTPAETTPPPAPKVEVKTPDWVHPMPAGQISSCYGPRWGTMHAGIDLFTDAGEPIVAVGAGTVVSTGWAYSGYGISVVVDHQNGFLSHYAHMQDDAVGVGQKVNPGDVLGYEGTTGDSTGPHLHFEVHRGMWNQIEPAQWLRDRGVQIGC